MKKILFAIIMAVSFVSSTFAQEPVDCRGLKVATGPANKGFSLLFKDIKDVTGLQLCEVNTAGALANLDALSTNAADIGMVQIDMLKAMSGSDENLASLQAVMPLNFNFLHGVASSTGFRVVGESKYLGLSKSADKVYYITKFSELRGMKVALVGSAQYWGRKLNQQLAYNMTFVDVDGPTADKDAQAMVKAGKVHALLTVSGWPSGVIKDLRPDSGLTLITYDAPANSPYVVKNLNYAKLGVYNIPTLGVQNVLVTRPFRGAKTNDVATLRNAIGKHLVDLQEGSYQPGWKEVKDVDANVDWQKFQLKK